MSVFGIYQHHERTLQTDLEADLIDRESGFADDNLSLVFFSNALNTPYHFYSAESPHPVYQHPLYLEEGAYITLGGAFDKEFSVGNGLVTFLDVTSDSGVNFPRGLASRVSTTLYGNTLIDMQEEFPSFTFGVKLGDNQTVFSIDAVGGIQLLYNTFIESSLEISGACTLSDLTASQVLLLDSGKQITSSAYTGTGDFVRSTNPTLVGFTSTGQVIGTSAGGNPTTTSAFLAKSNAPAFSWWEQDGGSNAQLWNVGVNGGVMAFQALDDGVTTGTAWMVVTRSGFTIPTLSLSATTITLNGTVNLSGLTASTALLLDSSKSIVSQAYTGTGNVVRAGSPALTGTVTGAAAEFTGTYKSTLGGGPGFQVIPATTTNSAWMQFASAGGVLDFGMDDSTASTFGTAGAYGTVIYRPASTGFTLSRGGTIDIGVSSSGAVTIPGTLEVDSTSLFKDDITLYNGVVFSMKALDGSPFLTITPDSGLVLNTGLAHFYGDVTVGGTTTLVDAIVTGDITMSTGSVIKLGCDATSGSGIATVATGDWAGTKAIKSFPLEIASGVHVLVLCVAA